MICEKNAIGYRCHLNSTLEIPFFTQHWFTENGTRKNKRHYSAESETVVFFLQLKKCPTKNKE